MLKFLSLFLFFFGFNLETSEILNFHELPSLEKKQVHQKKVKIRGFLYQTPEKGWVLASEPNLKTCCLGNSEKRNRQIFISEQPGLKSTSYAVVLEGILSVQNNGLEMIYKMENVQMIESTRRLGPWMAFALFVGLVVFAMRKGLKPRLC